MMLPHRVADAARTPIGYRVTAASEGVGALGYGAARLGAPARAAARAPVRW
ncbi:hypothetical protein SVIOM342S_05541 [Streptomyces violaceorubidus]